MGVRFHHHALAEFEAEALYYEAKVPGLGKRFVGEVEAAIQIAAEFPEMGSPFKFGTRRVFPKKFPFSIVYRLSHSDIVVVAIVADARKPGYWRNRRLDG
jgi:plasmid stabilization system protein ParE